eukprot:scaffold3028_cov174-Amphora_coffeaeformis.AAC.5
MSRYSVSVTLTMASKDSQHSGGLPARREPIAMPVDPIQSNKELDGEDDDVRISSSTCLYLVTMESTRASISSSASRVSPIATRGSSLPPSSSCETEGSSSRSKCFQNNTGVSPRDHDSSSSAAPEVYQKGRGTEVKKVRRLVVMPKVESTSKLY